MSNWERHGTRDLSLSRWHRQFLRHHAGSRTEAEECGMIDIDWLEYCARCKTNLFLVEAGQDVRQVNKCADQQPVDAYGEFDPVDVALEALEKHWHDHHHETPREKG